jgi:hypothetical protein
MKFGGAQWGPTVCEWTSGRRRGGGQWTKRLLVGMESAGEAAYVCTGLLLLLLLLLLIVCLAGLVL